MPVLELKKVSKAYRHEGLVFFSSRHRRSGEDVNWALRDVSLTVQEGEAWGVVGESGAGKSTLARIAAGLEPPSSGEALLDVSQAGDRKERKSRARAAQLIWQDAPGSLDPRWNVFRALEEPLQLSGFGKEERREQVFGLLEEVGLNPEIATRHPYQISGGEAQRVVIARALALRPRLLICDEPASALDVRVKVKVADLLIRLRRSRGLALLIVTHDLPLARHLTENIIVLKNGVEVERGDTQVMLTKPREAYTRLLLAAEPELAPASSFEKPGAGARALAWDS